MPRRGRVRWSPVLRWVGLACCLGTALVQQNCTDCGSCAAGTTCEQGQAWGAATGRCEDCPAGKQSKGLPGTACEYCPHSLELIPLASRPGGAGCRCKSHYVGNPTSFGSCASCSNVERAVGDDSRRVSCEPCADTRGKIDCIGRRTCECGGGAHGSALLCPAEGFYLFVKPEMVSLLDGESEPSELHDAYTLMACATGRSGLIGSRCRHWRECLAAGERESLNATCVSRKLLLDVDRGELAQYHSPECCQEGYRGPMCEYCTTGRTRIGGDCLVCEDFNWGKLSLGIAFGTAIVLWIMRSTMKTFQSASGFSAILVFYFQTLALLLTDRRSDIGGFVNALNLNMLKPGSLGGGVPTCLLAMPLVLGGLYGLIVLICYMTTESSTTVTHVKVRLDHRNDVDIVVSLLKKHPVFGLLDDTQLHKMAIAMRIQSYRDGENVVNEGDPVRDIRIVVEGSCVLKIGGRHLKDDKFESVHVLKDVDQLSVEREYRELLEEGGEAQSARIVSVRENRYEIKTDKKGDAVKAADGSYSEVMHHVTVKGLGNSFPDEHGKRMLQKGAKHMFTATAMEDPADPDVPEGVGSGRGVDVAVLTHDQFEHVFMTNKAAGTNAEFVKKYEELFAEEEAYMELRGKRTDEEVAARQQHKNEARKELLGEEVFSETNYARSGKSTVEVPSREQAGEAQHVATKIFTANFISVRKSEAEGALVEQHARVINTRCGKGACGTIGLFVYRSGGGAISDFYHACFDTTALKSAPIEIAIALYGPVTQDLMAMWVPGCIPSPTHAQKQMLAINPTIPCDRTFDLVYALSIVLTLLVAFGVPFMMWLAAQSVHRRLDQEVSRTEHGASTFTDYMKVLAEKKARKFYVNSWHHMDTLKKRAVIDQFAHELLVKEMEQGNFVISNFQMSIRKDGESWYPQWYMLRRVLLNLFYLRSKTQASSAPVEGSYEQTSVILGDYRVLAMMLLACSSVLQYHFHPFRKESENRLEMWSLQFLSIVIMIDYADASQNGLVALSSSFVFSLTLVVVSIQKQYNAIEREHKAAMQWRNIRGQSELFNIREHSDIVTKAGTISVDDADKTLWVGGIPDYMCAVDASEAVDPAADLGEQTRAFREQMLISNLTKCLEGLDGSTPRATVSTASTAVTYGPFETMKLGSERSTQSGRWNKRYGTISGREFGYSNDQDGRSNPKALNVADIRAVEAVDLVEEHRNGALKVLPFSDSALGAGTPRFQCGCKMVVIQKSGPMRVHWFAAVSEAERDEWVAKVRLVSWINAATNVWQAQSVVKTVRPHMSHSVDHTQSERHREHWAQPWHGHSWAMVTFQTAALAQRAYDRGIFVPKEGASDETIKETLESGKLSFKGATVGMLPGKWLDRHLAGQYQGHYGLHANLHDHLHGLTISRLQSHAVMYGATEDQVKTAIGCPDTISLKAWSTYDAVKMKSEQTMLDDTDPRRGEEGVKQGLITLILEEAVFNTIRSAVESNKEVFGESMLGNFGPDNFQAAFEALDISETHSISRVEFERALIEVLHVEVDVDNAEGALLGKADVDLVFNALAGPDNVLDWADFDELMHGRFKKHLERQETKSRVKAASLPGSRETELVEGTEFDNPLAAAEMDRSGDAGGYAVFSAGIDVNTSAAFDVEDGGGGKGRNE